MDSLTLDGKTYVSSRRAAEITGYTQDYIGQLAREKKVDAKRVGRSWYVEEDSLQEHENEHHGPHDEEEGEAERGKGEERSLSTAQEEEIGKPKAPSAEAAESASGGAKEEKAAGEPKDEDTQERHLEVTAEKGGGHDIDITTRDTNEQHISGRPDLREKQQSAESRESEDFIMAAGGYFHYESDERPLSPGIDKGAKNEKREVDDAHARVLKPERKQRGGSAEMEEAEGTVVGNSGQNRPYAIREPEEVRASERARLKNKRKKRSGIMYHGARTVLYIGLVITIALAGAGMGLLGTSLNNTLTYTRDGAQSEIESRLSLNRNWQEVLQSARSVVERTRERTGI